VRKQTYAFLARVRRRSLAIPMAFKPTPQRLRPMAQQYRTALSPPRRDEAHRLIIVAGSDSCSTATKPEIEISREILRLCAFCEHRSPPLPRSAVGCERMAQT
jgi:hypothetical protein